MEKINVGARGKAKQQQQWHKKIIIFLLLYTEFVSFFVVAARLPIHSIFQRLVVVRIIMMIFLFTSIHPSQAVFTHTRSLKIISYISFNDEGHTKKKKWRRKNCT
jgi:hypothetical protein